jgi:hypothetical protein
LGFTWLVGFYPKVRLIQWSTNMELLLRYSVVYSKLGQAQIQMRHHKQMMALIAQTGQIIQ